MRKKLVRMDRGMAVVIEDALLGVIGAQDATELELTTDGVRLMLAPVRDGQCARAVASSDDGFDASDPRESVRVIDELLTRQGLTEEHFRRLHHFGARASLRHHLNYCEGTERFTAHTNIVVARRLAACLRLRRSGLDWDHVVEQTRRAYPFGT